MRYFLEDIKNGYWMKDPEVPLKDTCWTRCIEDAWTPDPTGLDKPNLIVFLNRETDIIVLLTQHEP